MKYLFFILLFHGFTIGSVDKCRQIPALTCSAGDLNDGTGSINFGPSNEEQKALFFSQQREQILERFSQGIRTAKKEELNLALEATGIGFTEECESASTPLPPSCEKLLAKGLTERVLSDLTSGNNLRSDEESDSLMTEYSLRQTELYQKTFESSYEEASRQLKNPDALKRVENKLFPRTKDYLHEIINQHIKDPKQRRAFSVRINSIRFAGDNCNFKDSQNLSKEFTPNAFYQVSTNQFFFCNSMFHNGVSDYNIIQTIAHELSHSIDPCRITKGIRLNGFHYTSRNVDVMESEFPFGHLLKCLRDERSIAALPAAVEEPSENPFCDDGEQINESFCDWIATEILAKFSQQELKSASPRQFQNGMANVWRSFCPSNQVLPFEGNDSNHPPTGRRLTKLQLAHPVIRQRLNCPELDPTKDIYCDPNNYIPPQPEDTLEDAPVEGNSDY